MADNKNGRDKQAQDAERRQRERELAEQLERGDEPEPPVEAPELDDVEYPATGSEVVAAVGDREVESVEGTYTIGELVPDTDAESFDSPAVARRRIGRPTVAAAMKRVVEANETLPNAELRGSRRDAYEKTFRELEAVDPTDDDEGIGVVTDWIVERIREKESLPGSRDVRRRAAEYCRSNGHPVRSDDWLGV